MTLWIKDNFVNQAYSEGILKSKGNQNKAGLEIEKYLSVFREVLSKRNSKFLDLNQGYDWCCAYVYYLLKQSGYILNVTPLTDSNRHLASVEVWYDWAIENHLFKDPNYYAAPGDLVLFDGLIENVELDHIGIVVKNNDSTFTTSEGNFHNSAGIFSRKKDNTVRGYIILFQH